MHELSGVAASYLQAQPSLPPQRAASCPATATRRAVSCLATARMCPRVVAREFRISWHLGLPGWETACSCCVSMRKHCAGGRSIPAILKDAWKGKVEPTQAEELAQLVEDYGIKVMPSSQ